jgi:dolichyl-phosphate beta-glucosyltransferase
MLVEAVEHLRTIPSRKYEIIIVDDCSTDATSTVALQVAAKLRDADIRVVRLEKNRKKGGAVQHGVLHCRGERVLMVDADGASRFKDLELLWKSLDTIEKNGQGVAVGSRAHMVKSDAVVKVSS